MSWQVAQANVARLVAPPGDPRVRDFVDALVEVNELAEASPGFIWRLQTSEGDATGIRISDDERDLVNVSVWTSVDALSQFVHRSAHVGFVRRRREWFETMDAPYQVLWWVPAGHRPTESEALQRLGVLAVHGPSVRAFSFSQAFPPPETTPAR